MSRPELDRARRCAIGVLAAALYQDGCPGDALIAFEADLVNDLRVGSSEEAILSTRQNIANCYSTVGRHEEGLIIQRDIYAKRKALFGWEYKTFVAALSLSISLMYLGRHTAEAKPVLQEAVQAGEQALGPETDIMFRLRTRYGKVLSEDTGASRADHVEAESILADVARISRRVRGGSHPQTEVAQHALEGVQAQLARINLDA